MFILNKLNNSYAQNVPYTLTKNDKNFIYKFYDKLVLSNTSSICEFYYFHSLQMNNVYWLQAIV